MRPRPLSAMLWSLAQAWMSALRDALLAACAGKGFADLRDTAIVRLFASSGARG
jgi:hypothetical protein